MLLCSLTSAIAVSFVFLQNQKNQTRKEIKHNIIAGIDLKELVCLTFSSSQIETDLEWEHSKEFEYNNQMYDIVTSKTVGDTTHFWCWLDNEETKLNRQLNNLLATVLGTDEESNHQKESLKNFCKTFYFTSYKWMVSNNEKALSALFCYQNNFISINKTSTSPPPKA